MKKFVLITLVLAFLGGAYGWFFVYNKPHPDFENRKPDFQISANQLFNDYVKNKGGLYNGKVVEISGTAQKVDVSDTLVTLVFVFNEGMFGDEGIRCSFIPKFNDRVLQLKFPTQIKLKGFCSGYNDTDVILEHCSLTN
jgi:hypothetical protein